MIPGISIIVAFLQHFALVLASGAVVGAAGAWCCVRAMDRRGIARQKTRVAGKGILILCVLVPAVVYLSLVKP